MQYKRNIRHYAGIAKLIIKGSGLFRLFPAFIIFVLLPLMQIAVYFKTNDLLEVKNRIMIDAQIYIPIASVIDVIMILYVFFDHDGKEGIRFYEKKPLRILIIPEIVFDIVLIPVFIIYSVWLKDITIALYLRCVMINFYFFGSSVMLTALFGGISIAVVSCVVYSTLCILELVYGVNVSYFALYYSNTGYIADAVKYMVIAVVMIVISIRYCKKIQA